MITDIIGNQYGRLSVLSFFEKRNNIFYYLCRCSCGKEKIVSKSNLTGKRGVKSCGCLRKEKSKAFMSKLTQENRKLPEGVSEFNSLFSSYRTNARKKDREFLLTKEEFKKLIIDNCYYCGIEPKNITNRNKKSNGKFIYNGIDRVDNSNGYTINNCVTCCEICNHAKHTLSQEQFFNYLHRIARKYREIC